MLQTAHFFFLIIACSAVLIQCANIFEPVTPKDTDQALVYEARKNIDAGEYLEAIENLSQVSATYAAQNEVRVTFASAYAGACGMEFIPFFNNISNAEITPPNTLFKYLRGSFTDKFAAPNYCTLSEMKLKEIGSTAVLRQGAMGGSKEVNMLMAILSMAKMGAILRTTSDVDGANSLGDGNTDASFSACTNDAANITDEEVLEVATGFGLLFENLPALGSASAATDALTAISTVMNVICVPPNGSNCVILDAANLDPVDKPEIINTYRDLLESQISGLGTCVDPTLETCCP